MPSFQEKPIALANTIIVAGAIVAGFSRAMGCLVARTGKGTYDITLNESVGTYEVGAYGNVAAAAGEAPIPQMKIVAYPNATNPNPFTLIKIQFLDGAAFTFVDPEGFTLRVDRVAIGQAP